MSISAMIHGDICFIKLMILILHSIPNKSLDSYDYFIDTITSMFRIHNTAVCSTIIFNIEIVVQIF